MRAKYSGHCGVCEEPIEVGSDINKLLGDYVHTICKSRELERKRLLATVTKLPPARGEADRPNRMNSKSFRRKPGHTGLPSATGEAGRTFT